MPASPKTTTGPATVHAAAAKTGTAAKPTETKPTETKPKADELSLDFIGGAVILTSDLAVQTAPKNQRSEKQSKMDEVVKRLHTAWVNAGRASQWPKMVESKVVATYFVEPNKSAELKRLINRAVTFHNVRARFGTSFVATEALVTKHNLPKEYIGREVISVAIMDKRPRTTSESK